MRSMLALNKDWRFLLQQNTENVTSIFARVLKREGNVHIELFFEPGMAVEVRLSLVNLGFRRHVKAKYHPDQSFSSSFP